MKKDYFVSVISGDIIASTSLSPIDRQRVLQRLIELTETFKKQFGGFYRVIKGDGVECVPEHPEDALRIALILKLSLKTIDLKDSENTKTKLFKQFAIRIAIAYDSMNLMDEERNILDGKAIFNTGRTLEEQKTHDKERPQIKQTLFFNSPDEHNNDQMQLIIAYCDKILNSLTKRQSEIILRKVQGQSEKQIAKDLKKTQSTINRQSTAGSWSLIQRTLNSFSKYIQESK